MDIEMHGCSPPHHLVNLTFSAAVNFCYKISNIITYMALKVLYVVHFSLEAGSHCRILGMIWPFETTVENPKRFPLILGQNGKSSNASLTFSI